MAEGIRLVSVRRGVDPRRFALLAFGGAAGCTSPTSRACSRSGGWSCRASPPCSRPGACWRPTCATSWCASHVGEVARMTAPTPAAALRGAWRREGRARLGALRRARRASGARSTCATASRSSRSRSPLDGVDLDARRPHRRRSSSASTAATRSSTPTARPTRKSCSSTRASPSSASCRRCRRAERRPPRPRRAARRAAASISATGSRCPSIELDALAAGPDDQGPGDLRVGDDDGAAARGRARDGHAARLARHRARLDTHRDSRSATAGSGTPRIALPAGGLLGARLSRSNGAGPLINGVRGLGKSFGGAVEF